MKIILFLSSLVWLAMLVLAAVQITRDLLTIGFYPEIIMNLGYCLGFIFVLLQHKNMMDETR